MSHTATESAILVAGEWQSGGARCEIRSPYDNGIVGTTFWAKQEQLERGIRAAVEAFATTRKLESRERQRILLVVSDSIARDKAEFARLIALEAGKPMQAARVEVERAIFTFALAAEEAGRDREETIGVPLPNAPARKGRVRRFPVGPIAAITPFNFPLNLVAHKLAPAIAVGCPVVLKPAPQTPLTALKLARCIHEAGWPAGALSVLPLRNEDAAPLVEDDRLALLSFTGSAAVGWELKAKAGKKRVVLELGGNAAVIVTGEADIATAAEKCVLGGYSYAGQSCISVQRVYVARERFDAFLSGMLPRVQKLVVGDPLDDTTDVGPLIRESDAVRIEDWIKESSAGGAQLLCGGERKGGFVSPGVLTGTKPTDKIVAEEAFGPVVVVEAFDSFDEAIARVNDSRYGLQAGIFTRDQTLIERAFREIEVGGVIVNDAPTFRSDAMPYGGVKDSGIGREGVRYAMREMTELKILVS